MKSKKYEVDLKTILGVLLDSARKARERDLSKEYYNGYLDALFQVAELTNADGSWREDNENEEED